MTIEYLWYSIILANYSRSLLKGVFGENKQ